MPDYTVSGQVWDDADADAALGPAEPGLEGRLVELVATLDPTDVLDTALTAAGGLYQLAVTNPGSPVFVTARCQPPAGWSSTTPTSQALILIAAQPDATGVHFGQRAARQCFARPSSWVARVCWVPGRGVQVQFKRRGVPAFECFYPGTRYDDFARFRDGAASLGRWVRAFYFHRPHVPVAPGS